MVLIPKTPRIQFSLQTHFVEAVVCNRECQIDILLFWELIQTPKLIGEEDHQVLMRNLLFLWMSKEND